MSKSIIVLSFLWLLSSNVFAQDDHIITNDEDEIEVVAMILDKESGLPVCRFSEQVRINNSEFVPENRLGDVDMASVEGIRVCQEEDIWVAVEEEVVGTAAGVPPFAVTPALLAKVGAIGGVIGCIVGVLEEGLSTAIGDRDEQVLKNSLSLFSALFGGFSGIASVGSGKKW